MIIKKILKAWYKRKWAVRILDAIRLCQQQLPNDRFRAALNALFAIYDKDDQAYDACIEILKNVSKTKEHK